MHRHIGVDEGWVPPKVHCNLLMSMCCNVSKILHIKVVLWEDNQTDLIGLQTTWISSSIIKLMLNTFTEFVSKTNLNLYNKIWYKESSLLFDLQLSLRYIYWILSSVAHNIIYACTHYLAKGYSGHLRTGGGQLSNGEKTQPSNPVRHKLSLISLLFTEEGLPVFCWSLIHDT